ncbi:MAG: flavin reductase family protein [Bosea sp. (in: a-proteobacteria)]
MSMLDLSCMQHLAATPDGRQSSDFVARETYLKAMRQIASSVAVVTTDGQAGRHGATVTAFCSVSADPPTLLVCLRTDSRISAAVTANGVFTLSVLPASATQTARAFAGEFDKVLTDRFEGSALVERDGLAPAIGGALGVFCRVVRFEMQDSHTIFMGRVGEIMAGGPYPLTYLNGAYGCVQRDMPGDGATKHVGTNGTRQSTQMM